MSFLAADVAVITIVSGRHQHLRRQLQAMAALDPPPRLHIVVGMGDPHLSELVAAESTLPTRFIEQPTGDRLPLAAARNRGVEEASTQGASVVALLDVDCIPVPSLVGDYATALSGLQQHGRPAVVSGRVQYLPEGMTEKDFTIPVMQGLGSDNGLRVVPATDAPAPGDPRMLWSLNLGVTVEDWNAVGGFDERFEGYGGEDTDFGQRLKRAGGNMWWMRGARVFHQWHPVSRPPVEHVEDIIRNANLFHDTWGWYPMEGWLEEFERLGLIVRNVGRWQLPA